MSGAHHPPGVIAIPLRNRKGEIVGHALISIEDAALAQQRWHLSKFGYVRRSHKRNGRVRKQILHRVVLGLSHGDPREGDHINGNRLDNRRENLRVVTRAEQGQNVPPHRDSSTGVRGVRFRQEGRWSGWQAVATISGKRHYLGIFRSCEEADAVVRAFRAEHMPFAVDGRSSG